MSSTPERNCALHNGRADSRAKPLATRFIAALMAVFLLCGPHTSMLMRGPTRRLALWQTRDWACYFGGMCLVAAICFTVGELIRRSKRSTLIWLCDSIFIVAFGAGVFTNVWYHAKRPVGYYPGQFGWEIQTAWMLMFGVLGYTLAKPHLKLALRCRQACLIISPVIPIVAWQLFQQPTYPPNDPLVFHSPPSVPPVSAVPDIDGDCPVYLFVFDTWSFNRTFDDDGTIDPLFTNLAELTQRATVFLDTYSPGENTTDSMPRMLLQANLTIAPDEVDGQVVVKSDGHFVPSTEFASVFSVVSDRDYHTYLIGAVLPYRTMLGDQVDIVRTYPYSMYSIGTNLFTFLTVHARSASAYWTDPWTSFIRRRFRRHLIDSQVLPMYRSMMRDTLSIIKDGPRDTFAVFHLMMPHEPFILNEDGTYIGPNKGAGLRWQDLGRLEDYMRNLANVDRMIGEFIQAMREVGKFDDALIIMTSDHSWWEDPLRTSGELEHPKTRVPLVVKFPGQSKPARITSRFETLDLGALVDRVVHRRADFEDVETFLKPLLRNVATSHDDDDDERDHRLLGP